MGSTVENLLVDGLFVGIVVGGVVGKVEGGLVGDELEKVVEYKTEHACREAGKISIEGKNYEVCDGDVIHFRFNV